MRYLNAPDIRRILPKRDTKSHKGDNGTVLCVGGSQEYVSAIIYAGMAAYHSGCDIVSVAAPSKIAWTIHAHHLDLLTIKYPGDSFTKKDIKDILKRSERYDAVLLGPGIGLKAAPFVKKIVRELVKRKKKLVIDADALKVIRIQDVDHAILTPHKKELEILMENSRIRDMKQLQKMLKSNVLLRKGPVDEIMTSKTASYNRTGNSGMTVGGTGDVLAGLCAGFYARTGNAEDAAKIAAYVNGAAGDACKRKGGYGFTASDVVGELRGAIKDLCR